MNDSGPAARDSSHHFEPGTSRANSIAIDSMSVTYPNGFVGLQKTSIDIPEGKFCTLLGPSGSGKTTVLRAIAGLVTPSSGRIVIGDRDVTKLPIQQRNIGFVFQNYALFPHMTVADNIKYPLKVHKWPVNEQNDRVQEILDLIELPAVADRAVGELSGGQQQRVAIGRALAYRPALLLLDEPMGALDRRLRQQLGAELREIQQRTGITAVYVTHDQEEAFILSDEVAVMNHGELLQYSTPSDLYYNPRSRFVAEFLGETNIIDVISLERHSNGALFAHTNVGDLPLLSIYDDHTTDNPKSLVIRPEEIIFVDEQPSDHEYIPPISVDLVRYLFLGSRCMVTVQDSRQNQFLIEAPKSNVPDSTITTSITWKRSSAHLVDNY